MGNNEIKCQNCGETWDKNTIGYDEAYASMTTTGDCIACWPADDNPELAEYL